jgi:hypothetical protein
MIYVGLDDTDIVGSKGTGRLAREIAAELSRFCNVFGVTRHQLLVHPAIPYTSHNSSAVIHILASDAEIENVFCMVRKLMKDNFIEGSDPGLAVVSSNQLKSAVIAFGLDAKRVILTQQRVRDVAENSHIKLEGLGGSEGGVIGAVAGIGLAATRNDGRFLLKGKSRELTGIRSVSEITGSGIDEIMTLNGEIVTNGKVKIEKCATPSFLGGKTVLFVEQNGEHYLALRRD